MIFLSIFILSIVTLANQKDKKEDNTIASSITKIENTLKEDDDNLIENLQKKYSNPNIVGLLKILNTDYTTIVPQGTDNVFYLRHLPNKQYSRNGSTFLDYRVNLNSSRKLLIYGHNSSKYNMPFKILENYYDIDYYQEHKYIELVTSEGIKYYKIFSVYVETKDYAYYQKIDFASDDDWYKHITNLQRKSLYNTEVEITKEDNILILQTCSTHDDYKKYKKKYLLIISKEVNENEIN